MTQQASEPIYDKNDQYELVTSGLLEGETVIAVYDGIGVGTGFLGLTDRRVVIQDNSFTGKRTALMSIPYSQIRAVSLVSDRSLLGQFASSSTVAITLGGGSWYEISMRGDEKGRHAHDVILWHMK